MYNTWKEEGWMCPLNKNTSLKNIWRFVTILYFKQINGSAIKLEMKLINYKRRNNRMTLGVVNRIQRPFESTSVANVKRKLALGLK